MTIASEIQRIKTNIENAYTALEAKGATMPATEDSANLATTIASISGGGGDSEYTCLNATGSNISEGEKVYIASNTNLSLISYSSFTSLGYTGIASQNIANGASGSVKSYMIEPSQGLNLWDRVDGKGTVTGFFTDGNGTKYAVVVADAAYRTGGLNWSSSLVDTPLPNYSSESAALAATESATFNMDTIRSNYSLSNFPAFNSAYSNTITFGGVTYNGLLPNAAELQMIFTNRENLDALDTTLVDYPSNSLMTWNIGGNSSSHCWSSTEYDFFTAWNLSSSDDWYYDSKNDTWNYHYGVVPIFEIPVED